MAQKKKNGLGMGLDALFLDNSTEENSAGFVSVNINDIEPNREQPRKTFDEEALSELAASIGEHGIIQPLVVRPIADGGYQLIAGERRWRAARIAGLNEVPVVIREITDSELLELALVENLQREDLNPIEEAQGLSLLMETYEMTQEQAAKRVGKSRPAVANAVRLLLLPPSVVDMVREGKISAGHARALLGLSDNEKIKELADRIIKKGMSVRDTERLVKFMIKEAKGKKKPAKKRDIYYDEVELAVSDTLGRKAKVNVNAAGKGTIQIEFFGKEDLEKLMKIFENNDKE